MNTSSVEDLEDQQIQLSVPRGYSGTTSTGGLHQRPNAIHPQPKRASAPIAKFHPQTKLKETISERFVVLLKPSWNTIFVTASVIAVSLDPLFFYIPIIDEENKCLEMDVNLKNAALVLRSLFDITFIVHIIYQIREAIKAAKTESDSEEEHAVGKSTDWVSKFFDSFEYVDTIREKLKWRSFITDILAVLPVPQVLLVVIFFKMGGSGYLNKRKILCFFLLIQYVVVRIYRIYLSSERITKNSGIWFKGLLNFFLYILASHDKYGAVTATTTEALKIVLNSTCSPDSEQFSYGIFKAALVSRNTASKMFLEKLFYCFWWGMRNLSNFGTNLSPTSNYPWENCFAILVSISGLLIFLYLIGNMQTYMQMQTQKAGDMRQKMIGIERDLKLWMARNDVPDKLKDVIIKNIKQKQEEYDKDASLENMFSVLSWDTAKALKRHLCMDALKRVPGLNGMDAKVLKMICDYLKPVLYTENNMFAEAGSPADRMIIITEGTMWILNSGENDSQAGKASPSRMIQNDLKRGDFYGDKQLLSWAATGNLLFFNNLPSWTENVKCHDNVKGFTLSAKDLKAVVHKCGELWKYRNPNSD